MTLLHPASEAEARDIIASSAARRAPLSLSGCGTKGSLGRPAQSEATLSARALSGITLHEPGELVLSALAGTPLAEVDRALAEKNQELAFEPMDWRPLLGSSGEPTVGGLVASNGAGSRRVQAGSCRDGLIGVRLINGRAAPVKSGGRVMKNVAGLDLVKLVAGSWGTLGFLTEATFKVMPRPERVATLALEGLDDGRAIGALTAALGSPFEVTGAAHLPAAGRPARTVIRIQGFASSVDHRLPKLEQLLAAFGSADVLAHEEAEALWREIRDVLPLAEPRENAVWRLSTAPTKGPLVVARIVAARDARYYYDWGGGLVWVSTAANGDAGAAVVRAAMKGFGGHATLVRAPLEVRASVDVFEPLSEPLIRLTRGIKQAFDPAGIFEPGRMYAGI